MTILNRLSLSKETESLMENQLTIQLLTLSSPSHNLEPSFPTILIVFPRWIYRFLNDGWLLIGIVERKIRRFDSLVVSFCFIG